jgi:hypothetical protein
VTQTRDSQAAILKGNDLQGMQSSDEGTEGAYLPQETKVAVPQVQSGQDAGVSVVRFEVAKTKAISRGEQASLPPPVGTIARCRPARDRLPATGSPQSGSSPASSTPE